MNNNGIKYYAVLGFVLLFFAWFYYQVNQNETIYNSEIACVINNTCPDKWKDESVDVETFRRTLKAVHFLNADVQIKNFSEYTKLDLKINKNSEVREFYLLISTSDGSFELKETNGFMKLLIYLDSLYSVNQCLIDDN